jgi:hypothetical protein
MNDSQLLQGLLLQRLSVQEPEISTQRPADCQPPRMSFPWTYVSSPIVKLAGTF